MVSLRVNLHSPILRCLAVFVLLLPGACTEQESVDKSRLAVSFVEAINQMNAAAMSKFTASTLLARNQAWESASDGYGFVLAKTDDQLLSNAAQVNSYFSVLIDRLSIESSKPIPTSTSQLTEQFKGIEQHWQGLEMYLFLRGMGDVEHILVVGVNAENKIAAIYFN